MYIVHIHIKCIVCVCMRNKLYINVAHMNASVVFGCSDERYLFYNILPRRVIRHKFAQSMAFAKMVRIMRKQETKPFSKMNLKWCG